jgi:Rps23 Pro-64 3,4-dihydroxylase Tpa1-like proline 4-hydroxylase
MNIVRKESLEVMSAGLNQYKLGQPFPHIVIDNFLKEEIAYKLFDEFPSIDAENMKSYKNDIEIKKLSNSWDSFQETTYKVFQYLNSLDFIEYVESLMGVSHIKADYGLHGGGHHIHGKGGKLNAHLDYSVHPKLGLERRANLIIYLNPNWEAKWGGGLGFWTHNHEQNQPDRLIKTVLPMFNRAVIFDTTQNSWHGLPDPIICPEDQYRKSLAVYYLSEPSSTATDRKKALFAPSASQKGDLKVLELIKKRSQLDTAKEVFGDK